MAKRVNGGKSEYAKHLRPHGKRAAAKAERKAATYTVKVENGHLSFVYDDAMADLLSEGEAIVTRVSHVEPASTLSPGTVGWTADMRPTGGKVLTSDGKGSYLESLPPFLDGRPFQTRAEALAAERAWLTANRGL